MEIYKSRLFAKWAKKNKLKDNVLVDVIDQMERGSIDAKLGGFLYKMRISACGRGKRNSLRTIIIYKANKKAFFVYGFAKNAQDNITDRETEALKKLAKIYLGFTIKQIIQAVRNKELIEVAS